jgi:hypothetical protein
MAKSTSALSVSELEQMLTRRRSEAALLVAERNRLQNYLVVIDNKIRGLSGGGGAGGFGLTASGRARNAISLIDTLTQVMAKSEKPMQVGDIVDAVLKTGYRSTSANFRAMVNMTLIRERKRFKNTGRAMYELKG